VLPGVYTFVKKDQAHTVPFKIIFYGKAQITMKVPYLKFFSVLPGVYTFVKKRSGPHRSVQNHIFYGKAQITVKVPYLKFFSVLPGVYTSGLKKL
jgi:tRNA A37 threonylcarbamoyladenosine synthetase subunit TsaC/SUA5/YrdC